ILIPPFGLVRQINSKGFQGVFSIVLENKKDIGGIPPTSKSIEPKNLVGSYMFSVVLYNGWDCNQALSRFNHNYSN
ncbi:hypothetical protein ACYSNR_13350, partial [Enterococcus sp. LJL128]